MLGALILQVMERSEIESLKVMIYLIEGVLPKGYFSGSLVGLQVDMAVFREILSNRLPKLSKHLQRLQGTIGDSNYILPFPLIQLTFNGILIIFRPIGPAIDKRIHHAVVLDAVLHVSAEKLRATCLGSRFD